jgi:hypothetical protein
MIIDMFDDWPTPGQIGEMNQWSGRTWYRRSFVAPESFRGKKILLEFEAADCRGLHQRQAARREHDRIHPVQLRSHAVLEIRRREKRDRGDGR